MTLGVYVVILPRDQDYKVLGYFFEKTSINFEVSSNLFLRLNLDHEKSEYTYLKLKDLAILSYFHELKGKAALKISAIMVGLLLSPGEAKEKYQDSLKSAANELESLDLLNIKDKKFEEKLKSIYEEYLGGSKDTLNASTLKNNVINRTKEMLSGSRKDRAKAQELLELIETNEHAKIESFYKQAESALTNKEYEKAGKLYAKAAEIAESLLEEELAKKLKEKANNSSKVPELEKGLEKTAQLARDYLKREEFGKASRAYKNASDIAKKLMNSEKEEEYTLKAKALYDFVQVDQKFKK